jgi:hypothetical protein
MANVWPPLSLRRVIPGPSVAREFGIYNHELSPAVLYVYLLSSRNHGTLYRGVTRGL